MTDMGPIDTAVVQILNRADTIAMLASKPRALVEARSEIANLLDILNVLDQELMNEQCGQVK